MRASSSSSTRSGHARYSTAGSTSSTNNQLNTSSAVSNSFSPHRYRRNKRGGLLVTTLFPTGLYWPYKYLSHISLYCRSQRQILRQPSIFSIGKSLPRSPFLSCGSEWESSSPRCTRKTSSSSWEIKETCPSPISQMFFSRMKLHSLILLQKLLRHMILEAKAVSAKSSCERHYLY